ncbi:hypothetical protein PPERSA_10033 [Pseudocohnilembus persalinus]|uniref:Uncharacterized protein n=1 Tax=Pseudocohnilembus persalinus TaxID=266149 RepID=A0A0V0QK58_PSEPJ|nr:hypothetical protein PPERSA_10033 [Pseudocohnilembus persalinus]|eukprot:KRX02416.1 hypothetical protein PPERSA_10033 [Pseudocohnilembus persalinus]
MPPPHQHYRNELQGPPIPVQNQCYDFRVNQTPTTDLYDSQFVDRYYKPSTIYKYGDYYQESHDNLARYPISRHQEPNIVSVDVNNGLSENENLDEHFRAYKDSLHNNIYTYIWCC